MDVSDPDLEYLSPSFDPNSITVPRLRAILVAHDVSYPSSAKKSQLIDIFQQEVIPRARRLLAARSRTKRTSKGITDMPSSTEGTVNGDHDDAESMPPPPVPETPRRRSKKPNRQFVEDNADETTSSRHSSHKHPRTSDTDTGLDHDTKKTVARRSHKSEATPNVKIEEPEESAKRPHLDSAFSHENPFQSGSSPMTPSESRRKSSGPITDRKKSTSRRRRTDGVNGGDSALVKQEDGVVVPSSRTFDVPLTGRLSKFKREADAVETSEEFTPEEQLELVRDRAANGEVDILPPRRTRKRAQEKGRVSKSAPWVVIMTLLTGYATWWRREKIEVGYCGIGEPSSMALSNTQFPDWASVLQPECEPCPRHAYCYESLVTRCEPGFMLKSHPLSLGGLVPLPPTCEPDGEKVRRVKAVADRAVEELRERRAQWECGNLVDDKGKDIPKVVIDESSLKEEVSKKRRKGMSDSEFEDLWRGAIGEIIGREEVTSDSEGLTSTSLARLPLTCAARRSARLALARYRIELAGLITLLIALATLRTYILTSRADAARIPALVSTTLDRLATQAALHAEGRSDEGWISVGQLRDDVLRDVFSESRRETIWKGVTKVVERNANVRTLRRTGRAGDVLRVWEWVGAVGFLEGTPGEGSGLGRRGSARLIDLTGSGNGGGDASGQIAVRDGQGNENGPGNNGSREMVEGRKWDEGRPIY